MEESEASMKEILLSDHIHKAQIDDEDFPVINRFTWTLCQQADIKYAQTNLKGTNFKMHQLILPHHLTVDHEDHNGLNNQKYNLRGASYFQQQANTRKSAKGYSSKYKGVCLVTSGTYEGNYRARISHNRKRITLGHFSQEIDAAKAYNEAALEYFGKFAYLNAV